MPAFYNIQVEVGRSKHKDGPTWHRAVEVARQLYTAGKWDGRGRLVVHNPRELLRRLQLSPKVRFDKGTLCTLRQAAFELVRGVDYEVQPLSREFCLMHGIPLDRMLFSCAECGKLIDPKDFGSYEILEGPFGNEYVLCNGCLESE